MYDIKSMCTSSIYHRNNSVYSSHYVFYTNGIFEYILVHHRISYMYQEDDCKRKLILEQLNRKSNQPIFILLNL